MQALEQNTKTCLDAHNKQPQDRSMNSNQETMYINERVTDSLLTTQPAKVLICEGRTRVVCAQTKK